MSGSYKNKLVSIADRVLPILLFLLLLSGCKAPKSPLIATVNEKHLYLKDFYYEIYLIEEEGNRLEDYYQEKLGYSYWDYEYYGITMREAAKSSVITSVVMYEILADQAAQNGIALTQNELITNEDAAKELLNELTDDQKKAYGITYKTIKESIDRKALGEKYRSKLIGELPIDEDVIRNNINEEDYREYKTECLFVPVATVKEKNLEALSKDAKTSAYKAISNALLLLKSGSDMEDVQSFDENLKYETRSFIPGDKIYEKAYMTAATKLQNGEFSPVITTEYGYYVIHMLDDDSPDRYNQAVEEAITAAGDSMFAEVYNQIKDQYDITINFENWDVVKIGQKPHP